MTIYPKILLTVLPFLFLSLAGALGISYYFFNNALIRIADNWLELHLDQAVSMAGEQVGMLKTYELEGVLASIRKAQADAAENMENLAIGKRGSLVAVDGKGIVAAHPDPARIGVSLRGEEWFREIKNKKDGRLTFVLGQEPQYCRYRYFEPWDWYILIAAPESELYGGLAATKKYVLSVGILGALCLALALMLVTRRLTEPLRQLTRSVAWIGKGGQASYIPVKTRDESGQLARVFNEMSQRLSEIIGRLKKSEQKYRVLFESFPDGLATLDQNRFLECNRKFLDLLGCSRKELIGKRLERTSFYRQLAQDLTTESLVRMIQKAREGEFVFQEFTAMNARGRKYFAELRLKRLAVGDQWFLDMILRDVTEKKRLETMERARLAAESANRAKSEFLANVSHEIRTPMDAILGLIRLLQQSGQSSFQEDYLARIQRSADTLLRIINDLLDFSKIEEGKVSLETVEFQLEEVLDHVLDMFAGKTGERKLELMAMPAEDVPWSLRGDPFRLEQVLINLVSNAVKFTDSGEILIGVELSERNRDRLELRFSVRDTGIGIEQDKLEHIFLPFSQAGGRPGRGSKGTGLGLAICRRLVHLMDGEIFVESRKGSGSTFFFTARFQAPENTDRSESEIPDGLIGQGALIVHDKGNFQLMLHNRLKALGVASVQALDVHEAWTRLQKALEQDNPFDMVFIDNQLPDSAGIALARRINGLAALSRPRIIFMVPFGDEEIVRGLAEDVQGYYLTKPVKGGAIRKIIRIVAGSGDGIQDVDITNKENKNPLPDLAGVTILLVEDNPVNQLVQREILEQAGMEVNVASNGSQALARIGYSLPDLVLMDVQMPILDGLTATEKIRSNPDFSGLPIIGMTAYTMQEEQQKCFDAGMDEYLPKPVDPDRLLELISKWVLSPSGSPAKPPQDLEIKKPIRPRGQGSISTDQVRIPVLDVREGLRRLGGKQDLWRQSLDLFVKTYQNGGKEIRRMLQIGDRQEAVAFCHTMKGAVATVSAKRLYPVICSLEKELKAERSAQEIRELTLIEEELTALTKAINRLDR
ncbi:MAG: response regulator [Desulfohalobiaceae bacterium]|nr:response regulator [Desulfohalobiaceae bacterium]